MELTGREHRSKVLMKQDGLRSSLLPALRSNDLLGASSTTTICYRSFCKQPKISSGSNRRV